MTAQGQSLLVEERIRREAATQEAVDLLMEGRKAYAAKDYQEAVDLYRRANATLPYGPKTAAQRNEIAAHLADGSVALAQDYRRKGKYEEAKSLLNDVLVADPNNFQVQKSLEYFDDPIRVNPALTEEHSQNVDEVRRLLYMGEGYYNLADYDQAEVQFRKVLRIDKYNKAARRWLERCANIKSDYYRAAYDQARAELLMQVDQAWELAIPPEVQESQFVTSGPSQDNFGQGVILNKLRTIKLPIVDFEDTPLTEAMEFLTQKSIELDPDPNSDERGINFVVERSTVSSNAGADTDLDGGLGLGSSSGGEVIDNLRLRNVPLITVLDYIATKTGKRYRVDEYAVTLLPVGAEGSGELLNRQWVVPPTFRTDLQDSSSGGGGGDPDPFADDSGLGGGGIQVRQSVQELLAQAGVGFPDGATARYIPGSSTLIVNNTVSNLDLVDQIVEGLVSQTPKQIRIVTKFVEVSQENTDELGFDWLVTPFRVSSDFWPGGGTQSNGALRTGGDFIQSVGGFTLGNIPADTTEALDNGTLTSGLRSGDYAISQNSIDAVLNNPNRTAQDNVVAPGILSLTGLFTEGQVQMIMRGLAQKKGTDIMTAPSVIARSGETATIEIIREFIYPTEYEPPELPNQVGATGSTDGLGSSSGIFPVTPSTPTAFETRNTGVTLEIQPTIGASDFVIDLRFAPEIVEFEGFINYGSPITSPASDVFGNAISVTITENRIEMPVFASRRVNTGLTIYDGHTVAVGGLMREDVQRVEDSVPILGDLPWVGRLFRSESENHIKSNLIVFVTAQIIDATGSPVRGAATMSDPTTGTPGVSAPGAMDAGLLPPLN
ncbi:MAG: type II and III secretion system protein [Verrucomicrobiota bacterium JB023]|nr:type II and III secretion system protein [Verrucomicrobiota bacterium JB023]